jgi:hypothetical protein
MSLISNILCASSTAKIKELTSENSELKEKLRRSQDAINKTNAYYKSMLRKTKKN